MRPLLWVKMPEQGDEFGGAYFADGAMDPEGEGWKPLYEHRPCEHCAPAEEIPGPAPESMAEGE